MDEDRLKTDPAFGLPFFRRQADLAQFRRMNMACVYALGPVSGRPVKVSWAGNPKARLKETQTDNWHELRMHELLWTPGRVLAHRLEAEIKAILDKAGRNLRGEWYDVTADLVRPAFQIGRERAGIDVFTHDEMIERVFAAGERRAGNLARSLGVAV
jgi:hypothetical protein